ncbi:MAG: hypothetical protein AAF802_00455 [Planctomycetota bacterium]
MFVSSLAEQRQLPVTRSIVLLDCNVCGGLVTTARLSDHPDTEQSPAKIGVFAKRATGVSLRLAEGGNRGDWHGVDMCWL